MMMKGDTLIEVLVALSVAVVVISAITSLGVVSLNNAQFIRDQDQATKYASEGMEILRGIRNSDYIGFRSKSGTYCLGDDNALGAPVPSCSLPNLDTKYIRSVNIVQNGGCGANLVNTTVSVSWIDSKCASGVYCHSSKLASCFSTVPPVSGP